MRYSILLRGGKTKSINLKFQGHFPRVLLTIVGWKRGRVLGYVEGKVLGSFNVVFAAERKS